MGAPHEISGGASLTLATALPEPKPTHENFLHTSLVLTGGNISRGRLALRY